MKNYYLSYLVSSELSDDEQTRFSQNIASLIQEQGGVLEKQDILKEKRLAYVIKKQDRALLGFLFFFMEPQKLEAVKDKLKENEKMLRFMITLQKIKKTKPSRSSLKRPVKTFGKKTEGLAFAPIIDKTLESKEKPKEKVELKEIEKKLDEILTE